MVDHLVSTYSAIDGIYNGLIASNVCSPLITGMDILFSIFPVEKDARNGMGMVCQLCPTSYKLQLHLDSTKSIVKLSRPFFTLNLL